MCPETPWSSPLSGREKTGPWGDWANPGAQILSKRRKRYLSLERGYQAQDGQIWLLREAESTILRWKLPSLEASALTHEQEELCKLCSFCDRCYACVLSHFRCRTLCNPMDYSLPGSSLQGILQARILEWVAMPSSRRKVLPPKY